MRQRADCPECGGVMRLHPDGYYICGSCGTELAADPAPIDETEPVDQPSNPLLEEAYDDFRNR